MSFSRCSSCPNYFYCLSFDSCHFTTPIPDAPTGCTGSDERPSEIRLSSVYDFKEINRIMNRRPKSD